MKLKDIQPIGIPDMEYQCIDDVNRRWVTEYFGKLEPMRQSGLVSKMPNRQGWFDGKVVDELKQRGYERVFCWKEAITPEAPDDGEMKVYGKRDETNKEYVRRFKAISKNSLEERIGSIRLEKAPMFIKRAFKNYCKKIGLRRIHRRDHGGWNTFWVRIK